MRVADPDIVEFVEVLGQVAQRDAGAARAGDLLDEDPQQDRLAEIGALDLGLETLEMDDAPRWLVEALVRTAHHDPALAFALASRWVGQRALARAEGGGLADSDVTSAMSHGDPSDSGETATITAAQRFAPSQVVVIDVGGRELAAGRLEAARDGDSVWRTGLDGALLRDAEVTCGPMGTGDAASTAHREWGLLVGAVCLGTAQGALAHATSYARERQQFDTRLVDFAGLRALLGEMAVRVAQTRALLDTAVDELLDDPGADHCLAGGDSLPSTWGALIATAGRVAVDVCLDAIQVHGGYGYIEEYPVAGLLRDAVSLRARSAPRRASVRALINSGAGSTP